MAKQRREDDYASRRDYQTIQESRSLRIAAAQKHLQIIQLTKSLRSNKTGIGGFGGYIRTDVSAEISVNVTVKGSKLLAESFTLGNAWSRLGMAFPLKADADCTRYRRPRPHAAGDRGAA